MGLTWHLKVMPKKLTEHWAGSKDHQDPALTYIINAAVNERCIPAGHEIYVVVLGLDIE